MRTNIHPLLLVDNYKLEHINMYPKNMTKLYSNFTPRKSRMKNISSVVVFGIQKFIRDYLVGYFNAYFFNVPKEQAIQGYAEYVKLKDYSHIESLHDLGYLPIKIKALPEGSRCPMGVPVLTIINTVDGFGWLVNYLETLISNELWVPMTVATIANEHRRVIDKWSLMTTGTTEGNEWLGHDFSMRGMRNVEDSVMSGMCHLLSFKGTDVIPAIVQMEKDYAFKRIEAGGVPATEHSVMCMGTKEAEIETFRRLLKEYPTGILSIVSDTWDWFKTLSEYTLELKDEIMSRDGKLVLRPDSGDQADIIAGTSGHYKDISDNLSEYPDRVNINRKLEAFLTDLIWDIVEGETEPGCYGDDEFNRNFILNGKILEVHAELIWDNCDKQFYYLEEVRNLAYTTRDFTIEEKGAIQVLWEIFGGTINELGYKVLGSHIGLIYGDGIGLHNLDDINSRLAAKGFATTNWVAGFGSFSYVYLTRDSFGFAMKAVYGELKDPITSEVEQREIFKDPVTDDGTKRSAKGLLRVDEFQGNYILKQQVTPEEEAGGELKVVFQDGICLSDTNLEQIQKRLNVI